MTTIQLKMRGFSRLFTRLRQSATGATAVEYGLLAGLIALGIAGGIGALADLVNALFEMLGSAAQTVAEGINGED